MHNGVPVVIRQEDIKFRDQLIRKKKWFAIFNASNFYELPKHMQTPAHP